MRLLTPRGVGGIAVLALEGADRDRSAELLRVGGRPLDFTLPQDDTVVYASGHPGMIADLKTKIPPKGWKFKEERFWKE